MNVLTPNPTPLDHPFLLLFAIAFPIFGYISYRKNIERLRSGELSLRGEYLRTMAYQWALFLIGIALWQSQGRDWASLGLGFGLSWRFFVAFVLALLGVWFLSTQMVGVRRGDENVLNGLAPEFENLRAFMPHSIAQLRTFYGLSITAGVVEEVLWRGYLIWYLSYYMPVWGAAMVSAALFGAAHAYQGIADIPKFFVVGMAFSGLYLLSGSVWLPIIFHVAMDMIQGRTAFDYLRFKENAVAGAADNHSSQAERVEGETGQVAG